VDPMIFPGESDWELRPTQRLWSFSVDVADLLAFDRSCLLLLVAWRPPTMKLISRLAD
jgi:hypothetical protein